MHKVRVVLLVALWCVQNSPELRPSMSSMVMLLEGGMEVPLPPNPFPYLAAAAATGITWEGKSSCSGSANTTTTSASENEATPIMRKYEIGITHQSP